MSTTEPPTEEEMQSEDMNAAVPDAPNMDQSLSEKSPGTTELVTSVTPAMVTPSSSSQVILEAGQSTPMAMNGNPNVAPHDIARPIVPHQSTFNVPPRPNVPSSSQSIMRPTPPSPAAPSQHMGSRPPFGYNMVPHGSNNSSSPGHQFQPSNVTNQSMNGNIYTTPNSAFGLQPPIPMQPLRPNTGFPGPVPQNLSVPRLPLPPPRDFLQQASSEYAKSVPTMSSESNHSGTVAAVPQPMQLQPGPSFPRPETVGVPGNPAPGPPNFQMRPLIPSPSLYQNQIQILPGHGPVLQLQPQQWPHQAVPLQPNPSSVPMVRQPAFLPHIVVPQRSDAVTAESTTSGQIKEANQVPAQETENSLNVWTAHKTDAGLIYYYNSLTGKSTYEKPTGFVGEPEKVPGQSTPVSWEKIPGSDWTLVTTNDGKKYYYDTKNKVSSWKIPPEVAELLQKQQIDSANDTPTEVQNHQKPLVSSLPAVETTAGIREAVPLRQTPSLISPSALDTIKKKLQDADAATPLEKLEGNGDGNASDSSSDDDDDGESGPTKEDCILQFKVMLKERGVPPFAKWDKELPKIIFDPRFKLIPTNEARRAIFERYVRTRADEERREKKAAQKAAIERFRQLLEEASEDINHKTSFQEFKKKWGNDPRFKALDNKERESLFNEKVQAAERKIQSIQLATISEFKVMLRERSEITSKSRWSKVKEDLRNDVRYKAVKHEERETLFEQYIAELKSAEMEAEQSSKAKLDEQEKLRERERETRKRKEREEQEMERVKLKIRRKDAVDSYQALLVEKIKDPKISWSDAKVKLEKDPQGRATNPDLSRSDAEALFSEHVNSLYKKQVNEFRQLLSEVITTEAAAASKVSTEGKKTVYNSWSEAKRILQSDIRFSRLSTKDSESLWRRYVEDMARKIKNVIGDLKDEKLERERDSRLDRDHRKDKLDSPEMERSERDYKKDSKERERSGRDYRKETTKDRDYRRDTKDERSERDHRRRHGYSSDYSRRR